MIFFLDESGTDGKTPYEVTVAIAVPETLTWNLLQAIDGLEKEHFGLNLHSVHVEFKGSHLLNSKRFRHASARATMEKDLRRNLTRALLQQGFAAKLQKQEIKTTGQGLAAYGQASIAFVTDLLKVAHKYRVKAFAAVVDQNAKRPLSDSFLRKDYRFLLDRFAVYLKETSSQEVGILVFDETEKCQSRRLMDNLSLYCTETKAGYRLSNQILPAPFFVHSDLTPVIQISDICAYIINWAWRRPKEAREPIREDLKRLLELVEKLEWRGSQVDPLPGSKPWMTFGFFYLSDLRDKKDCHNSEEGAEPPPRKKRQKVSSNGPMPPDVQLQLFDMPSTKIRAGRIKRSGYLDI